MKTGLEQFNDGHARRRSMSSFPRARARRSISRFGRPWWTTVRKPVRVLHAQSRIAPLLAALDLDS